MKYVSNAKMNTSVESGTIFEGKCGLVDITIHLYRKNKFSGRGDTFYLSSNCVGISNMKLESTSIIMAIQEAEIIVNKEIITMKNDADKMLNSNIEISRECDADNCMDCDYREMWTIIKEKKYKISYG